MPELYQLVAWPGRVADRLWRRIIERRERARRSAEDRRQDQRRRDIVDFFNMQREHERCLEQWRAEMTARQPWYERQARGTFGHLDDWL